VLPADGPGRTTALALSPGRLALANLFIAAGTLILSAGGVFNSVLDEMDAFAISLVAGITVIFVGFLLTSAPKPLPPAQPWFPPSAADPESTTTDRRDPVAAGDS